MQVPGAFIKGQRLAKLSISGDKIDLSTWFDQLEKSFSYKDSSVQTALPACENQLPPAKNVKKNQGTYTYNLTVWLCETKH